MEDQRKHIDDLFREGLGDYNEAPPASVWSALEQRLPAPEAPAVSAPRQDLRWLWLLLLLALLGTVGYLLLRSSSSGSDNIRTGQQMEQGNEMSSSGTGTVTTPESPISPGAGPEHSQDAGSGMSDPGHNADAPVSSDSRDNSPENISGNAPGTASGNKAHKKNQRNSRSSGGIATFDPGKRPESKSGNSNASLPNSPKKDTEPTAASKKKTSSPGREDARVNRNGKPESGNDAVRASGKTNGIPVVPIGKKSGKETKPVVENLAGSSEPKPVKANPVTPEQPKPQDVVVHMGKKKDADKNATPQSEAPAKKTFEVTKQGVKILTDESEDDELVAAAQDVTPEPIIEETEVEKPAAAEEEPVQEPVLATGSGGGGGGSEPNVPLRNFGAKVSLEGGFKAGFEKTLGSIPVNSTVFSPYLQWNITKKVALVFSPAFRYNALARTFFADHQSYYNLTSFSRDSLFVYSIDSVQGQLDSGIQRNYYYSNSYDSIIFSSTVKNQKNWEIDLPLMLKFNLGHGFSLLGGMYLTYGNMIKLSQTSSTISGLQRSDTLSFPKVLLNSPAPNVPAPESYFSYNSPHISTAPPVSSQSGGTDPARFGYMMGVSYEIGQRFMVDVLLRQNLSDMRYIQNPQVRKIYTQPSVRILVGIKLFESSPKPKEVNAGGL